VSRICRLPDDLVDKIAAGEVVERPASVVKELVENALDAGARTITVEIEAGGKRLVRVRDDGRGMDPEDAELALERHATSKLRNFDGLQSLATHGFRGEALPSIAAVSHLSLRTREDSAAAGTEVEIRHGRRVHVRDAGHPRGTTVEVRDLFGAVPARRKFLRADATEVSHVVESLSLLALTRPDVGFFLTAGARPAVEAPPTDGLAARIYQLFGSRFLEEMVAVEGGEGWVRVRGFVSRPGAASGARSALRLFVNGRPVRDRALARAVAEAYRAAGTSDPRPEAVLFVDVPPPMVDVNVHPSKIEVRFAEGRAVFATVQALVQRALSERVRRPAAAGSSAIEEGPNAAWPGGASAVAEAIDTPTPLAPPPSPRALLDLAPPTVLGQHRNTYIVASDGEDLLLIDQHTAHERVRFEAILARAGGGAVEAQTLLAPRLVPLAPELLPLLEAHAEPLRRLGFEAEPFGGQQACVRAAPAVLGTRDPRPVLEALLGELQDREAADWVVSGVPARLSAVLACYSAVRAGEPLAPHVMAAIVRDLLSAADPALCPHGRPTMTRIARADISKWFGRGGWRRQ
jgi:DNA mismatch repair protein MutL